MNGESIKLDTSTRQPFFAWLLSLDGKELATIALNLCAFAWIGLNLSFIKGNLVYMPGCYVIPNWINILGAIVLVFASVLAGIAIKRGRLLQGVIALTFTWCFIATLIRTAFSNAHREQVLIDFVEFVKMSIRRKPKNVDDYRTKIQRGSNPEFYRYV